MVATMIDAIGIVAVRHRHRRSSAVPTPVELAERLGIELDQWQRDALMAPQSGKLLLASRQAGKSTTASIDVLHTALYKPGSLSLILSPSERQSKRLLRTVRKHYAKLADEFPVRTMGQLSIELESGSEIHALPGSEETIRGFSAVNKLVIDEASLVEDDLYQSVRPMLAVSGGEMTAMTTPRGKRGWFYREYTDGGADWHRARVTAYDIPRISRAWLNAERKKIGEWWFSQEYLCEFVDTDDQLYPTDLVDAAESDDVASFGIPMLGGGGWAS